MSAPGQCATIIGGDAGTCDQPAAYRDGKGRGWCLSHGPALIRHFGADEFEPLTTDAREFVRAFSVNGYGPVGTVWPDAPEGDTE